MNTNTMNRNELTNAKNNRKAELHAIFEELNTIEKTIDNCKVKGVENAITVLGTDKAYNKYGEKINKDGMTIAELMKIDEIKDNITQAELTWYLKAVNGGKRFSKAKNSRTFNNNSRGYRILNNILDKQIPIIKTEKVKVTRRFAMVEVDEQNRELGGEIRYVNKTRKVNKYSV